MPKIRYSDINIRPAGVSLVAEVNAIVEEFISQGYTLTLRQVYYQLVARNFIENTQRSYNNLGELIKNGRLAGLIDWEAIEDRTRHVRMLSHWNSPSEILHAAADSYHTDLWETQPNYIEVWVEKDALIGVVEQSVNRLDVPCFSCRGYVSSSEMWAAAQRMPPNKECIVLHLGDHDPSGMDMTRDIQNRLSQFGARVRIIRIALNMNQVEEYGLPPNPAKITDTRARAYVAKYGNESWELDALEPSMIDRLIEDNVSRYIALDSFHAAIEKQENERQQIRKLIA